MSKRLAIFGAGGHGKVVADAALLSGEWSDIVFFDDCFPEKIINGQWDIVGKSRDLLDNHNHFDGVVVGIGNNELRLNKTIELENIGAKVVSIIHPTAVISPFVSLGKGCVVFANSVINVDVKIGRACIVNSGSIVEHDCFLYDGVHLSPNSTLAGQTVIGERSWVGIGAVTKELITIGSDVTVGAGSVVIRSIPSGVTVAGNPAKILG